MTAAPRVGLARRLRRGLGVSLGTLLLLLLAGEVLVRFTTLPITSSYLALDAVVGRRLERGVDARARNTESGRDLHVRTSDLGLRGPTRPVTPSPGTRRVVLLGDSMVAALEVEEHETATHLLQADLDPSGSGEVEVFNAGVPASGTGQEWLLYRHVLAPYGAQRVVLVFFTGNDLGDNSPRFPLRTRRYWDLDPSGELIPLPYPSLQQRLNDALNRYSRLYVWQREFLADRRGRERARQELAAAHEAVRAAAGPAPVGPLPTAPSGEPRLSGSEWIHCRQPSADALHAWGVTRAVLRELSADCVAHGARLQVLALPCSEQVYPDAFEAVRQRAGELHPQVGPEVADELLAELCAELDLPFTTALPEFRAAAAPTRAQESDPLYYGNVGHLTPRGHGVLARALRRALDEADVERGPHDAAAGPTGTDGR